MSLKVLCAMRGVAFARSARPAPGLSWMSLPSSITSSPGPRSTATLAAPVTSRSISRTFRRTRRSRRCPAAWPRRRRCEIRRSRRSVTLVATTAASSSVAVPGSRSVAPRGATTDEPDVTFQRETLAVLAGFDQDRRARRGVAAIAAAIDSPDLTTMTLAADGLEIRAFADGIRHRIAGRSPPERRASIVRPRSIETTAFRRQEQSPGRETGSGASPSAKSLALDVHDRDVVLAAGVVGGLDERARRPHRACPRAAAQRAESRPRARDP